MQAYYCLFCEAVWLFLTYISRNVYADGNLLGVSKKKNPELQYDFCKAKLYKRDLWLNYPENQITGNIPTVIMVDFM